MVLRSQVFRMFARNFVQTCLGAPGSSSSRWSNNPLTSSATEAGFDSASPTTSGRIPQDCSLPPLRDPASIPTPTPDQFLLFWDPSSVVSQWYPSPFTINQEHYNCAEKYMMSEKAKLFGDSATRRNIMASLNPRTKNTWGVPLSLIHI